MMLFLLWFLFCVIAINQITRILTTVDLLETFRESVEHFAPPLGKLAKCIYCQSFWFSGIGSFFLLGTWPIVVPVAMQFIVGWLALHWTCEMIQEFKERYLNRAPSSIYAHINQVTSNSGESDSTT